jgi:hypothetical protein
LAEIKREKRRLDDLLTIRETELENFKQKECDRQVKEKYFIEIEKKMKHLEKKHEKQIHKLSADL